MHSEGTKSCFVATAAAAEWKYQQQSWVNNTGANCPALQRLQWRQVSWALAANILLWFSHIWLTRTDENRQETGRDRELEQNPSVALQWRLQKKEAQRQASIHMQLYNLQPFSQKLSDTVLKKKYNKFMQQKVPGRQTHKFKIFMERI